MADGLRFDGEKAGLFGSSKSGDRNDATNYMVVCPGCQQDLGNLSRFRPNRDGIRSIRCLLCGYGTFIGKDGQIMTVHTKQEMDDLVAKQDAAELARLKADRVTRRLPEPGDHVDTRDEPLIWTSDVPSRPRSA